MKIEHVAFNVADPVAMAAWYEANFGMRTVRSFGPPNHARFVADSSGQTMMELYRNPKAPVPEYPKIDPLILHVAFAVDDVRATRARLMQEGATAVGEVTVTENGDALAMLRDPWGFAVQLVTRATPMVAGG